MTGAWDWSLVVVLRSNKPCAMAKKKKKGKICNITFTFTLFPYFDFSNNNHDKNTFKYIGSKQCWVNSGLCMLFQDNQI